MRAFDMIRAGMPPGLIYGGGKGLERTMKKTADTEPGEKITEARYKAIDRGKAEALLSTLANYWRERQFYKTEDGDSAPKLDGLSTPNKSYLRSFALQERPRMRLRVLCEPMPVRSYTFWPMNVN